MVDWPSRYVFFYVHQTEDSAVKAVHLNAAFPIYEFVVVGTQRIVNVQLCVISESVLALEPSVRNIILLGDTSGMVSKLHQLRHLNSIAVFYNFAGQKRNKIL
jgi:hypothetical protein